MKTSQALQDQYENYYADGTVDPKRVVAARQSFGHITGITRGAAYGRVLDVGAGQGSLLEEMDKHNFAQELYAVEISKSGVAVISGKKISKLKEIKQFDGYKIDYPDNYFDFGMAVHVLEHVEHERLFLAEIARVCREFYIEVPLENYKRVEDAIRISGPFGHINFYNPTTFDNLLKTTGLDVVDLQVFAHDLEYEVLCGGKLRGTLKYYIRAGLLQLFGNRATRHMMYMAGAHCKKTA